MKTLSVLTFLLSTLLVHPVHAGSSSGRVRLIGEIPVTLGLEVIDTNDGIDFQHLGKQNISKQKVGQFSVDSNSHEGFKVRISSAKNGRLEKTGGKEGIAYSLDLDGSSGDFTPGSMTLRRPLQLIFSGVNSGSPQRRTFDISMSLGTKKLPPGIYSDTITVQLSAL